MINIPKSSWGLLRTFVLLGSMSSMILRTTLSCDSQEEKKIINLNHLANTPAALQDTIRNIGFEEMGKLMAMNPDSALNASVMEQSIFVFSKDSIALWPKEAKIRLIKAWFITMEDAELTNDDMPDNNIVDKARYHGEGEEKPIEFNEQPELYKHMVVLLTSETEKQQFNESFRRYWEDFHKQNNTHYKNIVLLKNDRTTVYVLDGNAWIEEFNATLPDMKVGLIVLKGHCSMLGELNQLEWHVKTRSTVLFSWGCGSTYNLPDYLKIWTFPITNIETGKGAINDKLTFTLIENLPIKWFKETIATYKENNPENAKKIAFPDDPISEKINSLR